MKIEDFLQEIDDCRDEIFHVSDSIWDFAEPQFAEEKSAELLCTRLAAHGFTIERNAGNLSTAFTAAYGSSGPTIGILAEYDALHGLRSAPIQQCMNRWKA